MLLSTGPVENAAANASISTWVKVLNNNQAGEVNVDVTVYSLNGVKSQIANSSFVVQPMSSEFDVFELTDIQEYEVEVLLSSSENVLVSVWGKDADANLVAAHRFISNELSVLSQTGSGNSVPKAVTSNTGSRKSKTGRHRNR